MKPEGIEEAKMCTINKQKENLIGLKAHQKQADLYCSDYITVAKIWAVGERERILFRRWDFWGSAHTRLKGMGTPRE